MRLFKRGKIWWVMYGGKPQKRVSTGQMNRQNPRSLTYVILRVDKRFRICVQISCNILVCHVE